MHPRASTLSKPLSEVVCSLEGLHFVVGHIGRPFATDRRAGFRVSTIPTLLPPSSGEAIGLTEIPLGPVRGVLLAIDAACSTRCGENATAALARV